MRVTLSHDAQGNKTYVFHWLMSALMPGWGVIWMFLLTVRDDPEDRDAGVTCFAIGIIASLIWAVIYFVIFAVYMYDHHGMTLRDLF